MNKHDRNESTPFSKYSEKGAYHWKAYYRHWSKANPMMRARYDIVADILTDHFSGQDAVGLDLGCGDGLLLNLLQRYFSHIIGVDLEQEGLLLAHQQLRRLPLQRFTLLHASGYHLPLANQSVDFVVALELIEHLDQPSLFIEEVKRVIRPRGLFVCTTPRRQSEEYNHITDKYHVHEYTGSELAQLLNLHFHNVMVKGFEPPWLKSLYLGHSGVKLIDSVTRLGLRMLATIRNPYRYALSQDADMNSSNQLVAVGMRPP